MIRAIGIWLSAALAAAFFLPPAHAGWSDLEVYLNDLAGDYDTGSTSAPTNEVPLVMLLSPAEGETLSGSVFIDIDALDPDEQPDPLAVYWSLDGSPWEQVMFNDALGLYRTTWDTTAASDGNHMIAVKASDGADDAFDDIMVSVQNGTTEPPAPASLHISDIRVVAVMEDRNKWTPVVSVQLTDNLGNPVSNAAVSGRWGIDIRGRSDCVTDGGSCSVSKSGNRHAQRASFSVEAVDHPTLTYDPSANLKTEITIER